MSLKIKECSETYLALLWQPDIIVIDAIIKIVDNSAERILSRIIVILLLIFALIVTPMMIEWPLSGKFWAENVFFVATEIVYIFLLISFLNPSKRSQTLAFQSFRLITALVFLTSVWYLIEEFYFSHGTFFGTGHRSEPSPFNALLAFIVWGLPCLWYTIFGRFRSSPNVYFIKGTPAELMSIAWDEGIIRISVHGEMDPAFNQQFSWSEITKVCFKDGGIGYSDILYLDLKGCEKPAIILTEALHGSEFVGELSKRHLFPEDLLRKAMGATDGSMYCWPP